MRLVDRETVEALELRAPSASTLDYETIVSKLRSGKIFNAFEDEERNEIECRIMRCTDHLIPSFHTFFKDVMYLKLLADCLQWLTALSSRDTLFTSISDNLITGGQEVTIQVSEKVYRTQPGSIYDQKDFGWRQLFAFAIRYHPKIPRPQLKSGLAKPEFKKDMDVLRLYANLAKLLGYKSSKITALMPHAPKHPGVSLEPVFVNSLKSHAPINPTGARREPVFVTNGYNEPIDRRCGLPRLKAFDDYCDFFYIDTLHGVEKKRAEGITPLFVQRSIYIAFFGQPGGPDNIQSPHPQGAPVQQEQLLREDAQMMEESDQTLQDVQSQIEPAMQDDSLLVSFPISTITSLLIM